MSHDRLVFYRSEDTPVYDDRGRERGWKPNWRWRYIAGNGRILAQSSEAYRKRIDAARGAARVLRLDPQVLATDVRWAGRISPVRLRAQALRIEVAS